MSLHVSSSAFSNGDPSPQKYSCNGQNVSPPLDWEGAPIWPKAWQSCATTLMRLQESSRTGSCMRFRQAQPISVRELPISARPSVTNCSKAGYGTMSAS